MPTNLPPECVAIERRYREADTVPEKIAALEELLGAIPKHKGTDHLRADYRRKLSRLKDAAQTKKGASRQSSVFTIAREGAGQVALIGPPNVGKSALVAGLTNAAPEVADYPGSTWTPTPGMMPIDNIQVQLIDTPPLGRDYFEPELMNLIRRADLVVLLVDLQAFPIEQLEETVAILEEQRIAPLHRQERYAEDRRLTFKPFLVLANKCDDARCEADYEALCELLAGEWALLPISATGGRHVEQFKQAVYQRLNIMRVYSKPPGKEPDLDTPFVLKKGSTVEQFAAQVHRDFLEQLKSARVWGSAAFDGQMVGRDHVLQDGDVVELRI